MTDDAHLTTLRAQVEELATLLDKIRLEISQPARRATETYAKTKVSASPAPWNDMAANLVLDVEAGARDNEQKLALIAYNGPVHRSTTSAASNLALVHLPDLIVLVRDKHPDRKAWRHAESDITSWARQARILLDQARSGDEKPSKAPGNLRCPNCDRSLYLPVGFQHMTHAHVYCDVCRDENGRRLSWPAGTWIAVLNARDTPNTGVA